MSQEMQITIGAKDTASKVIASVQQKVNNFGKDVGRSIVAIAGPMALFTMAFSKISEHIAEIAAKRKEAFDWGASLESSANKMGVTVEQFQAIEAAADSTGEAVDRVGKSFKLASDLIKAARSGNLDAAASLTALGINLENLEKTTPQEVLKSLAAALATTEDPAKRAQLAIAALGKSAGELQDILAKGFDIAGAIEGTEGLTAEEATLLREQAREERAAKNRERLRLARIPAAQRFLESPEGAGFLAAEQERMRRIAGVGAGMPGAGSMGGFVSAATLAADPRIQAEIQAIVAKRLKETEAAKPKASEETANALQKKAEDEKKKAEEEAKKAERSSKQKKITSKRGEIEFDPGQAPTVSSLRAIGGAFADEVATSVDYNQIQVDLQRSMVALLQQIAKNGGAPTDITKPAMPSPAGGYVPPVSVPGRPSLTGGSSGAMLA